MKGPLTELDVSLLSKEDVSSLDVSVDHSLGVHVLQTLKEGERKKRKTHQLLSSTKWKVRKKRGQP